MIVVDANVIAGAVISGPANAEAERVLDRDDGWICPPLWRDEFLNILAGYLRLRSWTLDEAVAAMDRALEFVTSEAAPDPAEVLRLVTISPCTAYDLEYVAVANALAVPLVTPDQQILAAFPGVAITPARFAP